MQLSPAVLPWLLAVALVIDCDEAHPEINWDGSIEMEQRYFWEEDKNSNLSKWQTSLKLELEFFNDWNNGDDQLTFEPFLRLDSVDKERSHFDVRQLIWTHLTDNWELSAGLGRVFWGVTESQHLVDIVNQTDNVENTDGEDKLGQPMIHYQYASDYGTLDAFLLPLFRPRTFPSEDSRLNGGIFVDPDSEAYQSSRGDNHIDQALRYSNTIDEWGVGLSWFRGTSREPDLLRLFNQRTFSTTAYYPLIDQFGVDIQLTTAGWLLKLEAIQRNYRDTTIQDFAAFTVGTEYNFVDVFGSSYSIGALAEYSWDERQEYATGPLQDDIFLGVRLALNDLSDSEILVGFTKDLDDSSSKGFFVEGATRVSQNLTANVELRYFESNNPADLLFRFRDDSFIQVGLEYFFD